MGGETVLIGLCAGFGYSLYSIFGKVLVGKYESLTVTVYTFLIAAAATLLISRPAEMAEKVMGNLSAFPAIFLGSFVTVGLPYLIYSVALKHIESSRASIIASFEVVAASLFGGGSLRGDFKRDESCRDPVGGDSPDNVAGSGEGEGYRFREFAEIKGLCLIFAMFYAKLH